MSGQAIGRVRMGMRLSCRSLRDHRSRSVCLCFGSRSRVSRVRRRRRWLRRGGGSLDGNLERPLSFDRRLELEISLADIMIKVEKI